MKRTPNILVICSDEHNPRMAGYRNHPYVKTPNLDRLATEGVHFTRAYCNSPVCGPSRMSFITGKYVHEIESWFMRIPLNRNEMTWARRLDQAGIPATMLGKMDFSGDYQDGGFTEHKILLKRPEWNPYPRTSPWSARLEGYSRPDKRKHLVHAGAMEQEVIGGVEQYPQYLGFYNHDRKVTDWALEFLRDKGSKSNNKPWALYVGLLYPHWPFRVPQRYFDMYYPDNIEMPRDAVFPNERLHPSLQHFQKALNLGEVTEDMIRRTVAAYYGMITAMDEMIGEILDELKNQGLDEDTYVIYTSDHGESLGEHGLFYKQCSYESSVGVPLIIKGPDLPKGRVVNDIVSLVDLYPTIMDIAGLECEQDRQGSSWLRLIHGDKTGHKGYAFSEFHGNFFKDDWFMIVKDNYKYTYYTDQRPSLFHLAEDPYEMNDLATDPAYKEILLEFEKLLRNIVDPEEVSFKAKKDLGLIGPNGEDFTRTLTVDQANKV